MDDQQQREEELLATAKAVWEDLAARARTVHCPTHYAVPWRVMVIGDTRDRLRLQLYGCCDKLQLVVNEMINADPRISGPR